MNAEKLKRLQMQVRIGGKGTPRRKKKVIHQTATTDDKRLQSSLKKLSVSTIPGIEEVNIIKDDLTVIHFNNPKAQASLSANTFAVTGHGETKKIVEMLPEILPQLGQETVVQLRMFANSMTGTNKTSGGGGGGGGGVSVGNIAGADAGMGSNMLYSVEEEDDVPMLVNDFDEVAKVEASAPVTTTKQAIKTEQILNKYENVTESNDATIKASPTSIQDTNNENIIDSSVKKDITSEPLDNLSLTKTKPNDKPLNKKTLNNENDEKEVQKKEVSKNEKEKEKATKDAKKTNESQKKTENKNQQKQEILKQQSQSESKPLKELKENVKPDNQVPLKTANEKTADKKESAETTNKNESGKNKKGPKKLGDPKEQEKQQQEQSPQQSHQEKQKQVKGERLPVKTEGKEKQQKQEQDKKQEVAQQQDKANKKLNKENLLDKPIEQINVDNSQQTEKQEKVQKKPEQQKQPQKNKQAQQQELHEQQQPKTKGNQDQLKQDLQPTQNIKQSETKTTNKKPEIVKEVSKSKEDNEKVVDKNIEAKTSIDILNQAIGNKKRLAENEKIEDKFLKPEEKMVKDKAVDRPEAIVKEKDKQPQEQQKGQQKQQKGEQQEKAKPLQQQQPKQQQQQQQKHDPHQKRELQKQQGDQQQQQPPQQQQEQQKMKQKGTLSTEIKQTAVEKKDDNQKAQNQTVTIGAKTEPSLTDVSIKTVALQSLQSSEKMLGMVNEFTKELPLAHLPERAENEQAGQSSKFEEEQIEKKTTIIAKSNEKDLEAEKQREQSRLLEAKLKDVEELLSAVVGSAGKNEQDKGADIDKEKIIDTHVEVNENKSQSVTAEAPSRPQSLALMLHSKSAPLTTTQKTVGLEIDKRPLPTAVSNLSSPQALPTSSPPIPTKTQKPDEMGASKSTEKQLTMVEVLQAQSAQQLSPQKVVSDLKMPPVANEAQNVKVNKQSDKEKNTPVTPIAQQSTIERVVSPSKSVSPKQKPSPPKQLPITKSAQENNKQHTKPIPDSEANKMPSMKLAMKSPQTQQQQQQALKVKPKALPNKSMPTSPVTPTTPNTAATPITPTKASTDKLTPTQKPTTPINKQGTDVTSKKLNSPQGQHQVDSGSKSSPKQNISGKNVRPAGGNASPAMGAVKKANPSSTGSKPNVNIGDSKQEETAPKPAAAEKSATMKGASPSSQTPANENNATTILMPNQPTTPN